MPETVGKIVVWGIPAVVWMKILYPGIPAASGWQKVMDERFDDTRLKKDLSECDSGGMIYLLML